MKASKHDLVLQRIFSSLEVGTLCFTARESSSVEFKESFNWGSKDKYGKTIAAFANNRGGYLIFGVTNTPRKLVGLASAGFESQDEAIATAYLNSTFSPEIRYEKFVWTISGKKIGVIYTTKNSGDPVVAIKTDGDIKEAEIYYRYSARSEKIKYPEMKTLLELARDRERKSWMDLFQRVSKIGPTNAGIMDLAEGTIEGDKGHLLIDASLVPKLQFIKEGNFSDTGKLALKLVGDVRPVNLGGDKIGKSAVRLTSDPSAPSVREESVLEQYPLTYENLLKQIKERYSDFKENDRFHQLLRSIKADSTCCKVRLLDPAKPRGSRKNFYNERALGELDKHYTKK